MLYKITAFDSNNNNQLQIKFISVLIFHGIIKQPLYICSQLLDYTYTLYYINKLKYYLLQRLFEFLLLYSSILNIV